jgi:hypothetical protein
MQHLDKLTGKPCNTSEGCHTREGAPRAKTVSLGKSGSWPTSSRRGVDGIKVNNNPGRNGSHLD